MKEYELKLKSGKVVIWNGINGFEAARNYTESHIMNGDYVVAWRDYPRKGIFLANVLKIIE